MSSCLTSTSTLSPRNMEKQSRKEQSARPTETKTTNPPSLSSAGALGRSGGGMSLTKATPPSSGPSTQVRLADSPSRHCREKTLIEGMECRPQLQV